MLYFPRNYPGAAGESNIVTDPIQQPKGPPTTTPSAEALAAPVNGDPNAWVRFWLDSALRCKDWHWDADQHEMAEEALKAAIALAAEPKAQAQAANEIAERLRIYGPLVKAAINLLAAVDERHDQEAPLKYTIPYGAVNALREALGAAPSQAQAGGRLTAERVLKLVIATVPNADRISAADWLAFARALEAELLTPSPEARETAEPVALNLLNRLLASAEPWKAVNDIPSEPLRGGVVCWDKSAEYELRNLLGGAKT